MRLWNADGSPSELSGNGLRCLAALVAREQGLEPGATVTVATGAGPKTLEVLRAEGSAYEFRAQMGQPADSAQTEIDVNGETHHRDGARAWATRSAWCWGRCPDAERFDRAGPGPVDAPACFPPAPTSSSRRSRRPSACAS